MKLNWDIIRELLEKVETHDQFDEWMSFSANKDSSEHDKTLVEHCEVLLETGFLEGRKISSRDGVSIACQRLKLSGHAILDSMRNDTIWNKVKGNVINSGIEGLKQIPALAIKLILTGTV